MRNKFADVIYDLGKKNKKVCAIVADISPAGSIKKFREKFPNRFINCGVAEQSMIGIAAGLASQGFKPFCYTISTFALYRPFEMIRVDLAYQKLPVVVIGMGAGVIYSTLGSTHHTMEDIAISTSIPNMRVLAPCDPIEMEKTIKWCINTNKRNPVYIRLGKAGEPTLSNDKFSKFEIDKIRYHKKGSDICIISYGTILKKAFEIENKLKNTFSISIVSNHSLKPLDKSGLKKICKKYKMIVIIEEHVYHGGLSEKIKNLAFDSSINTKIISFNLKDEFIHSYGSYEDILNKHGISNKKIIKQIINEYPKNKNR